MDIKRNYAIVKYFKSYIVIFAGFFNILDYSISHPERIRLDNPS